MADDKPNPDKLDSVLIGLEEARRQFDQEDDRATKIETKATALITIDAVLISFILPLDIVGVITKSAVVLFAFVSIIQALRALTVHEYKQPTESPRNISGYISRSENEFGLRFLELYIGCIEHNIRTNEARLGKYRCAAGFCISAILSIGVMPLLPPAISLLAEKI